MSFLRFATLSSAITSFLVVIVNLTDIAAALSHNAHFINGMGIWLAEIAVRLLFYLALAGFFTALFLRQKG
jgi:hypothetical protein